MMRTTSEPLASRLDPSRITSRDAALLLHSSWRAQRLHIDVSGPEEVSPGRGMGFGVGQGIEDGEKMHENALRWQARGRRRGFFTSCRAPRELDFHPPRRLFPVHRSLVWTDSFGVNA